MGSGADTKPEEKGKSDDFTKQEKTIMLRIAEYDFNCHLYGLGVNEIEARLIELISVATNNRLNLSR